MKARVEDAMAIVVTTNVPNSLRVGTKKKRVSSTTVTSETVVGSRTTWMGGWVEGSLSMVEEPRRSNGGKAAQEHGCMEGMMESDAIRGSRREVQEGNTGRGKHELM